MKLTDFYIKEKIPVTSVNKKTGAVVLNSSDVGAIPQSEKSVKIPILQDGIVPDNQLPKYVKSINGKIPTSQIPISTPSSLGGIKIGTGLLIDEDGTLNVDFSSIQSSTSSDSSSSI